MKACIEVFANEVQDVKTAEKFISKLLNKSNTVPALLTCKKYKLAYLTAVQNNNVKEIQAVMEESRKGDAKSVVEMCEKYISLYTAPQ